jgi:hypothetical protein
MLYSSEQQQAKHGVQNAGCRMQDAKDKNGKQEE